nr:unnamed protein product [Naegleria fowleri]
MSSASSSNMIHDFPSKHIPSSTENASYPLDIHFLLRTQLQKKRRSKHLEGGSENDLEEHVCLLTRKNHNEDENLSLSSLESTSLKQQDEVETSDSEGDFENVSK